MWPYRRELVCAELTERYEVNPMDVWREASKRLENTRLQNNDSQRQEGDPIVAGTVAAGWTFYYRDPGCAICHRVLLLTSARKRVLESHVLGLVFDLHTVFVYFARTMGN